MVIEIKDENGEILSSREVELKELNLLDRGKFLDLMMDLTTNPANGYYSKIIEICRICTDYQDSELNEFSDGELVQLFHLIAKEKQEKIRKKKN
jgi:hypothetical protein